MDVVYSEHAKKRMKERGISLLEAEHVLRYPKYVKKSYEGRKVAVGEDGNKEIKVVFIEEKSYIKVITVI
ncbi:MAG: DUF4258 domain-containing protein [Candidatus Aenigmarchaeota archaeon]|nr:DUF4258 domain-containing protein [Candidatus Aenigmarchaeota archaeon]